LPGHVTVPPRTRASAKAASSTRRRSKTGPRNRSSTSRSTTVPSVSVRRSVLRSRAMADRMRNMVGRCYRRGSIRRTGRLRSRSSGLPAPAIWLDPSGRRPERSDRAAPRWRLRTLARVSPALGPAAGRGRVRPRAPAARASVQGRRHGAPRRTRWRRAVRPLALSRRGPHPRGPPVLEPETLALVSEPRIPRALAAHPEAVATVRSEARPPLLPPRARPAAAAARAALPDPCERGRLPRHRHELVVETESRRSALVVLEGFGADT